MSGEVRRQMEEEDRSYFPDEFQTIDPEQPFYWAPDGGLVLVFDEASVAAGGGRGTGIFHPRLHRGGVRAGQP